MQFPMFSVLFFIEVSFLFLVFFNVVFFMGEGFLYASKLYLGDCFLTILLIDNPTWVHIRNMPCSLHFKLNISIF